MEGFNETKDHNKRMSMICNRLEEVQQREARKDYHNKIIELINQ